MENDLYNKIEIIKECEKLKECASTLSKEKSKILLAKEKCDRKSLKVEEKNLEKNFDELVDNLKYISNLSNELSERILSIINEKERNTLASKAQNK